jgi:acetyl-CoA carboxylase carboxyltransferase component
VSLVDTPGFMVGPDTEATAQVRHVSRMFVAAAHLRVPMLSVVLRKGYGLGAMAMTGGGFHETLTTVAWPTGEFGGMGLEGAVRLGYRKELEALPEGPEREALFNQLLAQQYDNGSAIHMAATLEIDAVIDPAATREWLVAGLAAGRVQAIGDALPIDSW